MPLRSAQGTTVYELSLEPQADRQRHVIGVTLALRDPGDGADTRNLLEPEGNWHGLHPFDFPARDFAAGIDGSSFGRARKIFAARVGLVVRIVFLEAQVRPLKKNEFELDKLSLDIEVDNSPR